MHRNKRDIEKIPKKKKIPKKQAVVGTLLAAASLAFFVIEALS